MNFNDYVAQDSAVFFNQSEFAELHTINGVELSIVIDNDRLKERTQKEYEGISIGEILFFVSKEDLGDRPEEGTPIKFGKRLMHVADCKEDMGMYEIILTQNRGTG